MKKTSVFFLILISFFILVIAIYLLIHSIVTNERAKLKTTIEKEISCTVQTDYNVSQLSSNSFWEDEGSRNLFVNEAKINMDSLQYINANISDYYVARVTVSIVNKSSQDLKLIDVSLTESSDQVWVSNRFCAEEHQFIGANSSINYEFGILYNNEETTVEEIINEMGLYVNCCLEKENYSTEGWLNFKITTVAEISSDT